MGTKKKTYSILIIDDDQFLRDMYSAKFTEAGFDVTESKNAEEALALIKEGARPDIITTDMVMPGMGGKGLVDALHKEYAEEKYNPVCVILSNEGQAEDITRMKDLAVDGYIIKANTIPSEVVSTVTEIADNARA